MLSHKTLIPPSLSRSTDSTQKDSSSNTFVWSTRCHGNSFDDFPIFSIAAEQQISRCLFINTIPPLYLIDLDASPDAESEKSEEFVENCQIKWEKLPAEP